MAVIDCVLPESVYEDSGCSSGIMGVDDIKDGVGFDGVLSLI